MLYWSTKHCVIMGMSKQVIHISGTKDRSVIRCSGYIAQLIGNLFYGLVTALGCDLILFMSFKFPTGNTECF
jgi:hypothetical protein